LPGWESLIEGEAVIWRRVKQTLEAVGLGSVLCWGARLVRFLRLLGFRFLQDGGLHHTASLTYTTLLSLVPLMTVSLAVFSAFPVSERVAGEVQDFVFQNFVPASGEVIREHLLQFSLKASNLSGAGTVFLVIVAVMMMANIDRAFNTIWQVKHKRNALGMFMVYWSILSLGPIFIGISVLLTSYLVSLPAFADAAATLGLGRARLLNFMPVIASSVAFTLLYMIVPNRHVPLRHAVAGGLLAGVLFEVAKRGFALYVTTFPTYQAIYGAMAAVPVFLIWIYLSWLVTLLGAEFTYCLGIYRDQWHPQRKPHETELYLAFRLVGYLWQAQNSGRSVAMEQLLTHEPSHSETELEELLLRLSAARLVLRTEQGEWALARDLSDVSFLEFFWAGHFVLPKLPLADEEGSDEAPQLRRLLRALREDMDKALNVPLDVLYGNARNPDSVTAGASDVSQSVLSR
jgi:membrane protein